MRTPVAYYYVLDGSRITEDDLIELANTRWGAPTYPSKIIALHEAVYAFRAHGHRCSILPPWK